MCAKVLTLAVGMVLCVAGGASAIVVDGVNDFPPAALIDADGGDTEFAPIDLLDVYVDFDGTSFYVGYGHDHDGWTGVQIGIAFVTSATGGGTFDPWAHMIGFAGLCLPDYIAYVNLDSGWTEWCIWNGSDWDRIANVLNWVTATEFDEIGIPYADMGIDCYIYSQVFLELWVTQDGNTKGPLDLSYNDDLQLSTPSGTLWDIDQPVMISCYHCIDLFGPSGTEDETWGGVKSLWR